jgi:hypothetical protein
VNMPPFGLGKVTGVRSASHRPNLSKASNAA